MIDKCDLSRLSTLGRAGVVAILFWVVSAVVALAQSASNKARLEEIDGQINAMASRNTAPKMLDSSQLPVTTFFTSAPLVTADYDWSEPARVREAVRAVRKDTSDEMWWRLRQHDGDNRYCLAVVFDDGIEARNVDVGEYCFDLTQAQLCEAYKRHLPKVAGHFPHTFQPEVIVDRNEKKWTGRPLFELQIEVCQEAMKQFASLKSTEHVPANDYRREEASHTFTPKEISEFTNAMRHQIDELTQTKKPVLADKIKLEGIDHNLSPWEPLRQSEADQVRTAYKEAITAGKKIKEK